jgi:hypothetical protein
MTRAIALAASFLTLSVAATAQGQPTPGPTVSYSTVLNYGRFDPLTPTNNATCQGTAGLPDAFLGTALPVNGGNVYAHGLDPNVAITPNGYDYVIWSVTEMAASYLPSQGVCGEDGVNGFPLTAWVDLSQTYSLSVQLAIQNLGVSSAYSTCVSILGIGPCVNQFQIVPGLINKSEIATLPLVIALIPTLICPPGQIFTAQANANACCDLSMGVACGECGGIQCDGSCTDPCAGEGGGGGGEGSCGAEGDGCASDADCCGTCLGNECYAVVDPIIIDLTGRGYTLTSAQNGVKFDFSGNGKFPQISWTAAGWNGGFLVLDRNGNGKIDNGSELFGNLTPQPTTAGKKANGFLALAVYDLPANGGNGDGWIDEKDAIYSKLLIWVDKNHNGISEPGELLTLKQAGVLAIELKYAQNTWKDAFGNTFRYSSQLRTTASPNQVAYDVLLQATGGTTAKSTAATKQ